MNLFLLHLFVYSILKIERGKKKKLRGLAEDLCLISCLTVTAVANVRNSWNQCSFCDGKSLIVIECKSCWMFLLYRIALALNLHLNKICSKMYCGLSFLFPFMFCYLVGLYFSNRGIRLAVLWLSNLQKYLNFCRNTIYKYF